MLKETADVQRNHTKRPPVQRSASVRLWGSFLSLSRRGPSGNGAHWCGLTGGKRVKERSGANHEDGNKQAWLTLMGLKLKLVQMDTQLALTCPYLFLLKKHDQDGKVISTEAINLFRMNNNKQRLMMSDICGISDKLISVFACLFCCSNICQFAN